MTVRDETETRAWESLALWLHARGLTLRAPAPPPAVAPSVSPTPKRVQGNGLHLQGQLGKGTRVLFVRSGPRELPAAERELLVRLVKALKLGGRELALLSLTELQPAALGPMLARCEGHIVALGEKAAEGVRRAGGGKIVAIADLAALGRDSAAKAAAWKALKPVIGASAASL